MENSDYINQNLKYPKMKAFRLTQKNFALAGISPNLLTQSYPLNGKILMGFLTLGLAIISLLMYVFNDANTFIEYTQSIYMCSLATLIVFAVMILILKRVTLYEFINGMDETINISPWKLNLKD